MSLDHSRPCCLGKQHIPCLTMAMLSHDLAVCTGNDQLLENTCLAVGAGIPLTDFSQPCGSSSYLQINVSSCWYETWTFYNKISSFDRPQIVTATHLKIAYPDCLNLQRVQISLGIWGDWICSPSAMENALIIRVWCTEGSCLTQWCIVFASCQKNFYWRTIE